MYVTKITSTNYTEKLNDYDNITSSNYTDILNYYGNITSTNYTNTISKCTNIENHIDKIIPTLILTIPCGVSFLCMSSLTVYTIIKPLKNK